MYFFSSSSWYHFRIFLKTMNFNNISSFTNLRCRFFSSSKWDDFRISSVWWISTIFHHWPKFVYLHSSSNWDDFRISLTMVNLNYISSLSNVRRGFPLHQNEMISEFSSAWWISRIFHHWRTTYVLFFFIKMRSFLGFSYHDKFHLYFIIDQRLMCFCSWWKWDRFRISLRMMNLNYISSQASVRCTFSLHQNEIVLEFVSAWWISTIFLPWPKSDARFFFIKMR